VIAFWQRLTLRAICVFLDKKIADNLETTGQILMQLYKEMYFGSFYKSNKSSNISPWPMTIIFKINGSMQDLCLPRSVSSLSLSQLLLTSKGETRSHTWARSVQEIQQQCPWWLADLQHTLLPSSVTAHQCWMQLLVEGHTATSPTHISSTYSSRHLSQLKFFYS